MVDGTRGIALFLGAGNVRRGEGGGGGGGGGGGAGREFSEGTEMYIL